jgi:DNA excision repair protein ERCC-2
MLYGGLLAREQAFTGPVSLRLLYCHPDSLAVEACEREESAASLAEFLDQTLDTYGQWLARQAAHEAIRDERLSTLSFPFASYRPYQRAMARRAYRALRDRQHLLLEAPTGSGKTAAVLFPAVRALQPTAYRRVIFLTSRGSGALTARDALKRMDPEGAFLRHISITARDKACFLPGTPCEPDACPYARGYWDKLREALPALLERRSGDPATIADVARQHEVCPFELSLDAASWSDVIIGDYNYLFDPVVRLQRLAGDPATAVLVDESHQLSPRVRDMLSLSLRRAAVREALAESPPDTIARRLRGIDRQLLKLRREAAGHLEQIIPLPEPLLRALQRFVDEFASGELTLEGWPACQQLLFTCSRWLRSESWYSPERFVFTLTLDDPKQGTGFAVGMICLDAGPWVKARLDEFGGHVRFSGTVSPLHLYQSLHGIDDGAAERAGNPFSPHQLGVLVVPDVPTYLRARLRSLPQLVDLVATIMQCGAGHHLVAFPSFEYLEAFAVAFAAAHAEVRLQVQARAMTEAQQADYLAQFQQDETPLLGLVVLGGIFGESVDFAGARLAGIVCVGVGLPPPSLTRTSLQAHFDSRGMDGGAMAFQQPAMVKVLQMAGRLLRSPEDRGVLFLVDARFRRPEYQRFFPGHWRPEVVRACDVRDRLDAFWRPDPAHADGSSTSSRDIQAEFP